MIFHSSYLLIDVLFCLQTALNWANRVLASSAVLDNCHCEGLRLRQVEPWQRYCNLSLSAPHKKKEMAPKIDGTYSSWPWTVVDRWLKLYNLPGSTKGNFSSLLRTRQSLCVSGLSPSLARRPGSLSSIWAPESGNKTTAALVFGALLFAGSRDLITLITSTVQNQFSWLCRGGLKQKYILLNKS